MEIFMMFDNGENKNTPAFACISKRINGDNFDEQKFDELCDSFKRDVKKMIANQESEKLLAILSKEEEVIA